MLKNDQILDKIHEHFPTENFTIQADGNLNVIYLDGKKFGVRWTTPSNPIAASANDEAFINMILNSISRVLSGTIIKGAKPAPAFKEEKKEEKVEEKVEEKKEKFEVAIPEVLEPTVAEAVEPPSIDTTSETPVEPTTAPKKKTSKKKKASEESPE